MNDLAVGAKFKNTQGTPEGRNPNSVREGEVWGGCKLCLCFILYPKYGCNRKHG